MYTIVTASQKGGSGKTTLSGHLAVEADRAGAGPVVLIDTDPQGSLAHWWNARSLPTPQFVKAGLFDLGDALEELRKAGVKLVFIDTPPAITSSISHVVGYANLVVVPTRPSPHDLRAVGATVDIAERHQKPLIFVLNAATARARITAESAVALSQHGTVAPVTIHHRVDFAASMVDGRTVGEILPRSASAREITELWSYIQFRLSRLMRDPQILPDFMPKDQAVAPLLSAALEEAEASLREAEGPAAAEPPSLFEPPTIASAPVVVEAPANAKAPIIVAAPATAKTPVIVAAPANVKVPVIVEAPAKTPIIVEAPANVPAPAAIAVSAPANVPAPAAVAVSAPANVPAPAAAAVSAPANVTAPAAAAVSAPVNVPAPAAAAASASVLAPAIVSAPTIVPASAISEEVQTVEPPPFYVGPDRRLNPPGTPYFGVERRANPQSTFGRRSTLPNHNEETGGRK